MQDWSRLSPADIYLLKVNNRYEGARYEICSKLTIKTPQNDAKSLKSSILDVSQGSEYAFLRFFPDKIYKTYFSNSRTMFPLFTSEAVVRRCSSKYGSLFPYISRPEACNSIKKETLAQMLSY